MTEFVIPRRPEPLSHMKSSFTGASVFSGSEPSPTRYLSFAREDIEGVHSERAMINALSNAKRALHLQAERFCEVLGYDRWRVITSTVGFPRKLEFLGQCGIVAPPVLRKLNALRNEVEHEYASPAEAIVLDYIDVVELYLAATATLARGMPNTREYYLGTWKDNKKFAVHLPRRTGLLRFYRCDQFDILKNIRRGDGDDIVVGSLVAELTLDVEREPSDYCAWMKEFLTG